MLFLLTGDVQIGKTRWLSQLVEDLGERGVPSAGVLAPGVWRERGADEPDGSGGAAGNGRFEKLGINNVLLPEGERISFARRRDLALAEGSYDAASQSSSAKLAWNISDAALARVNAHFDNLAHRLCEAATPSCAVRPALLVVDELGQLELLRGGGLTSAMTLLDKGATPQFPHALVVVREWLLDRAVARFAAPWGGTEAISPNDDAHALVLSRFPTCPRR